MGRRMGRGTTRRREYHTPPRFLSFSLTGRYASCMPPCFGWFFPPEAHLLRYQRRGSMHPTCCLVSVLFFIDGAVCIPHAALFPFNLYPPEVPPPATSTRRRASHTPPRFCLLFIPGSLTSCDINDEVACIPPCLVSLCSLFIEAFPPAIMTRQRESHTPPHFFSFFR